MTALFDRLAAVFAAGHAREVELLADMLAPTGHLRDAAVLIAVTDRAQPGVLMIHRPHTMRTHPGQAAFPGGKLDPGEDAVTAALREAQEELGLPPAQVRVVGPSDPFRTRTGYDIVPVLALVPPDLPLVPNPAEVDSWFEPSLAYLLDPANAVQREMEVAGQPRGYREIVWNGHRIWGVTAAIIANLSQRMTHAELFG